MDWRPLVLVLVVVLAGCGSVIDGGSGPKRAGQTPTLTPAPVPEETATPVPFPPGVTPDRVTNPDALLAAHRSVLEDQSYTLQVRVRVGDDPSRRVFRVETSKRYVQYDRLANPWGNTTNFADGENLYMRTEYGNTTEYGAIDGVSPPRSVTVDLSRAFLQVGSITVFETTIDGETAFVVRGTYPTHPRMESFQNFTFRAIIEPNGFIRSLNVSYVRVRGMSRRNITRSFAYSDVGATTVERPDWVSARWNGTSG